MRAGARRLSYYLPRLFSPTFSRRPPQWAVAPRPAPILRHLVGFHSQVIYLSFNDLAVNSGLAQSPHLLILPGAGYHSNRIMSMSPSVPSPDACTGVRAEWQVPSTQRATRSTSTCVLTSPTSRQRFLPGYPEARAKRPECLPG
jgi:ribosome modulation factor